MKAVAQRVSRASVSVSGKVISRIGRGLMILIGVEKGDTRNDADYLARKLAAMRIFPDENGVMNRSVTDVEGEVLVVSQFTLAADTRRGNRPSYINAAGHDLAIPLYEYFCGQIEELTGRPAGRGEFGADMAVELVNDGPVTIVIDSPAAGKEK